MADSIPAGPLTAVLLLTVLPFALLSTTSYVKLSVVLSMVRNAVGVQGVPSGMVITLLSILLSVHIMAPVVDQVRVRAVSFLSERDPGSLWQRPLSVEGIAALSAFGEAVAPPVQTFLSRHAGAREAALFEDLAQEARPTTAVPAGRFSVLLPAFLITELSEALQIGFVLFLPFLVVDLVIASILVSLGMTALNPTAVALPFKLLLFVLVDGFYVLSEALVRGYD